MSGGSLQTDFVGIIRFKRVYRHVSAADTGSNAMEIELEDCKKDRCDNGTERWGARYHMCGLEKYSRHCGKFIYHDHSTATKSNFLQDPINGGQLAAAWGTRETFIAIATTNLPMIFPILKVWLGPYLPSNLWSSNNSKAYKTPRSKFLTIGGSGASSRNRHGSQTTPRHTTDIGTFENDSEEQIFAKSDDLKMHDVPPAHDKRRLSNAIVVSKQVSITSEGRYNGGSVQPSQHV
jgi:hypothetical protein